MNSATTFRTGKNVYLRLLAKEDAETLQKWMNDPEVTQFLMRVFPVSLREEEEWIEKISKNSNKELILGIVTVKENVLIGSIGLHSIDLINRTATTGAVIGEKAYWGQGYGTEAKMLMLEFAFNSLDLYGVLSRVLAFNGRSLAYAKKCGYEEIGRIPNWLFRKGARVDEVILAVTAERWRPLWEVYRAKNGIG